MKNLNEESEIFSHDEKLQLKSNPVGNLGEKINPHNNIHHEGNNLNQEQRIPVSNNNNQNGNYRLKFHYHNTNQMNMHGMNHQHYHQHQHQHDFSNPRYLYYYILGYLSYANYYIQKSFTSITSTLDLAIANSSFSPNIKTLIHTKQIFLIIYIINIQYLLYVVEKISFLYFLNQNSRAFMIFSLIILYLHFFLFKERLFVERDEELEKFVLKRNPQAKRGKCEHCDILKVVRSSHCVFCNRCVKKYQLHSDWFNICVGTNNELLYALTLFFIIFYFCISNFIFCYYILFRRDLLSYLILIYTLFTIAGIYITFNSGKFLYQFVKECLLTNLTFYEKNNIRRLNYISINGFQRTIFNPFDKGTQRNLEEMLINTFDINIYSNYKNNNIENLSEIIDDNDKNNEEEEFNRFNDADYFKLMLKLVEHFDPLVTSKQNVYKFVDGKEIINWNRLMIFTVFDIINSPLKDAMINQARYYLEQREKQLKERNERMQKVEDEKIDESKNSEDNKEIQEEEEKKEIKEEDIIADSKEDNKEGNENEEKNMNEKDKEDN